MTKTIGELKKWLEGFDDDEIFIGQVWTADDFGVGGEDGREYTPNQEMMAELHHRFWRDAITNDTQSWLDDVLFDIDKEFDITKGTIS